MNENAIRQAREEGTLISAYSDVAQLESVVRWKIVEAQRLRGQQTDENTMKSICSKTAQVLMRDYPNFTDKEFDLVLEGGISGKLGRETWVSGAGVLQWLNHYQSNPVRIRVVESQNEVSKPIVRLTKEEIARKNQIAFSEGYARGKKCYEKNGTIYHKEGFAIPQWPSIIYQEFRNRGVIAKPTQEQMDYAEEKAKEHEATHPLLLKTEESKEVRFEDTYRSYLLEAHYKEITSKSVTTNDIINNNF